ncbi:hypothetical protein BJX66DRAFT_337597 [Aspergillus keveii]|uniref:Capsule polysaccharide biosynthesis protein n=1 Tax=Aspergillus keveii TaxID=714993 RepID=A0ABR4G6Z7_9EURO
MTATIHTTFLSSAKGLAQKPPSQLDLRPESEIRAQLNSHIPVTSERNVWSYWGSGFDSMPVWRQRNVINWVRRDGKRWTVRVLDTVPGSPNHIHRFIDAANLPAAVNEGRMKGLHAQQGISDFVRLATVYQHGGVYMDVGVILIRDLDDICWSALEDPSSPYQVGGALVANIAFVSFFLASRKGDAFIERWLRVFLEIWRDRDSHDGSHKHPLIRHLGLMITPAFPETTDWEALTDYSTAIQACTRVRTNREPGPHGFDGPAYFHKHFFLLPLFPEMAGPELTGAELVKALLLPYTNTTTANTNTQQGEAGATAAEDKLAQSRAHELVHSALTERSAYKFYGAFADFGIAGLAAKHWDNPQHANDDCLPGTWGDIFRYGTVHYQQTRTITPLIVPDLGEATEVGMLEAVAGTA